MMMRPLAGFCIWFPSGSCAGGLTREELPNLDAPQEVALHAAPVGIIKQSAYCRCGIECRIGDATKRSPPWDWLAVGDRIRADVNPLRSRCGCWERNGDSERGAGPWIMRHKLG